MTADLTFLDKSSLLICTLRRHSSSSSTSSIVDTQSSSQDPISHQCNYFLNIMDITEKLKKDINKVLNPSSKESDDGFGEEKIQSSNQKTIIVKPTSHTHIDEDPEEYFAAIKRKENAEREVTKLRGETCIKDEINRTNRQRRPGLTNRLSKRSHFSLKQSVSSSNQKTIIVKPTSDAHIAEDPEEYFAAIKKKENAEREVKKLRGEACIRDGVNRTTHQRRPGLTMKRTRLNHFSIVNSKGNDLEAPKSTTTKEYDSPRQDANLSKNIFQTEEISVCQQYNAVEASREKTGGSLMKFISDMKCLYDKEIILDPLQLPITPDTSPDRSPDAITTMRPLNVMEVIQMKHLETNKVVDPSLSADKGTVDDADLNDTSAHKKRFKPKPPSSPSFRDSNISITPKKTNSKPLSDDKTIPDAHAISTGMKKSSLRGNLPPRSPYSRVPRLHTLDARESNTSGEYFRNGLAEKGDDLPSHILFQNQLVQSPLHHETSHTNEKHILQTLDILDVVDDIQTNIGDTNRIKDRLGEVLHEENEQSESVGGQSSPSMNTTVVPAGHQGDELPPQIFIQNQPSQSPLHCEATNTIEEVLQSLDVVDDDIQTNVGDTDRLKDRLGEVLHEENEQTESIGGQSSASMDTSVLPARHQESFSISAEQHIEIETRVPKQRGRPKLGTRNSKQKSLAGGTAFVSGVRRSTRMKFKPLEHWRGEKLLFGCVDEGLPTLLGVKCSTPDGGKKVKLCVSDEQYTRFLPNAAFY